MYPLFRAVEALHCRRMAPCPTGSNDSFSLVALSTPTILKNAASDKRIVDLGYDAQHTVDYRK